MPRDTARHPGTSIQGMLRGEKLSPGFVSSFSCSRSRFGLGLSAALGSSQPLPLLREPRAPSDVVCPKTLLGKNKKNKPKQSGFDRVVAARQPRSCPGAAVPGYLALPCLSPLAAGSGGARRALHAQVCWEGHDGSASAPAAPGQHGRTRPASPRLSAALAPQSLPAAPQPSSHFLIARKWPIPPGLVSMFQWLTDPSPWPLRSFSCAGAAPFPRHFGILCLGAHPFHRRAGVTPLCPHHSEPFLRPMWCFWGVLTSSAPLRQGIAHVSGAVSWHSSGSCDSSVQFLFCFLVSHQEKAFVVPLCNHSRGHSRAPGCHVEVAACPIKSSLGLQPAPNLIPGWSPILPTGAAPLGPLSLWTCSAVFLLISCPLISGSHCTSCHRNCSPAG